MATKIKKTYYLDLKQGLVMEGEAPKGVMTSKKLGKAMLQKILNLHLKGQTIWKISSITKVHIDTIHAHLDKKFYKRFLEIRRENRRMVAEKKKLLVNYK